MVHMLHTPCLQGPVVDGSVGTRELLLVGQSVCSLEPMHMYPTPRGQDSMVYGDKELYQLAWLATATPFAFVPHLPALLGLPDDPRIVDPGYAVCGDATGCRLVLLRTISFCRSGVYSNHTALRHQGASYDFSLVIAVR